MATEAVSILAQHRKSHREREDDQRKQRVAADIQRHRAQVAATPAMRNASTPATPRPRRSTNKPITLRLKQVVSRPLQPLQKGYKKATKGHDRKVLLGLSILALGYYGISDIFNGPTALAAGAKHVKKKHREHKHKKKMKAKQ
jgi:hypothetical protein